MKDYELTIAVSRFSLCSSLSAAAHYYRLKTYKSDPERKMNHMLADMLERDVENETKLALSSLERKYDPEASR